MSGFNGKYDSMLLDVLHAKLKLESMLCTKINYI